MPQRSSYGRSLRAACRLRTATTGVRSSRNENALAHEDRAHGGGCRPLAGLAVLVVQVPPLVRRGLRVALGRVLPLLLASERGDVEVRPGAAHVLVAAAVDEVGAEDLVTLADERVGAVPLAHAEVGVEVVRERVPGHIPTHPCLPLL